MLSLTRTSTLMALVCKHTHTHTYTEIYNPYSSLFSFITLPPPPPFLSYVTSELFTDMIRPTSIPSEIHSRWLPLCHWAEPPPSDKVIKACVCVCFFRSVWGNPGVLHVSSDLWRGRLQEPWANHRRGDGHARLSLRLDWHVRRTHTIYIGLRYTDIFVYSL